MDRTLFYDLYAIPGMTEFRLKNLLEHFRTPEAIFAAQEEEILSIVKVDQEFAQRIHSYRRSEELAESIRKTEKKGVQVISYLEENYPTNLKGVPHMPPVLFIRGEITEKDRLAVALVGTRHPSYYGKQVTDKIARELASVGVTIVSGLARGVDTIAHKSALAVNGRTIAVLGCGIDVCYPPENRNLSEEIAQQGAVISEYPLGMKPLAINFPKRNRIISGLSKAVVAIEAGEKSGVLNTCAWAREQGKVVYAVPGRIGEERSLGTNRLIRDGAKILTATEDLLTGLGIKPVEERELPEVVTGKEKIVLEVLTNEPLHIDEIAEVVGIPMAELLDILFQMEIKGVIHQLPGKFFARAV